MPSIDPGRYREIIQNHLLSIAVFRRDPIARTVASGDRVRLETVTGGE